MILILLVIGLIFISSVDAADNDTAAINDELADGDDAVDVDIIANENVGIFGNTDTGLKVRVVDKNGKNVTGGTLTFVNVFGKDYTADVKDGMASCRKVFVGETGKFNITCNYNGLNLYNNASSTLVLNIPVADTFCKNIVATRYGDTVYFSGNVVSNYTQYKAHGFDDAEEVTEGNVTVFVDGQELGICDVDINGNYVYIWKTTQNLIGKTVNFTGYFSNNLNHFKPSNFSKSFTFQYPLGTEISYDIISADNASFLITGTVKDEKGSAVSGGELTVNDYYSVPVDANGNFSFYITDKVSAEVNYEIGVMDFGSKADITVNKPLMNGIRHTELTDRLIELCKQGSPYVKFGNGNGKTVIVNAGTHGGELPSQVAAFNLINLLADYGDEIDGTIYIFPTVFPEATASNVRIFNGINLNTIASENGTVSNNLVKFARSVNASGLGDFHSTRHSNSDVGITCVMGSLSPTGESDSIAKYVHNQTGYQTKIYPVAGVPYDGAIEDYSNILGGPAITSEVLCNHRAIEYGTPEISFNMMRAFLGYFGFDINDMISIPYAGKVISLNFTSPYNYNSSNASVILPDVKVKTAITAKAVTTVYNGGKYLIATLKDAQGNPIKGVKVSTNLKSLKASKTDKNGQVKWLTNGLAPKSYRVVLTYGGNDKYLKATKKVTVKVTKAAPKISAKAKKFKSNVKTKRYAVTLKTNKNKAISKVKLTLKVKGKTYKAITNAKGKATFKITKLTKKGTFTAIVKYSGSKYYSAKTVKAKITIK